MGELLQQFVPTAPVQVETRYLHRGFIWGHTANGLALVPYHELMHRYQTRRRVRQVAAGASSKALDTFIDLAAGDLVVHRDHGIARFLGLKTLETASGGSEEFLTLEFSGKAKLHVPASQIELVQKYIGAFKGSPELSHSAVSDGSVRRNKSLKRFATLQAKCCAFKPCGSRCPAFGFPPTLPGRRNSKPSFRTRRLKIN
jgi:transcription-repair coupling factor (superfamily II helicase)